MGGWCEWEGLCEWEGGVSGRGCVSGMSCVSGRVVRGEESYEGEVVSESNTRVLLVSLMHYITSFHILPFPSTLLSYHQSRSGPHSTWVACSASTALECTEISEHTSPKCGPCPWMCGGEGEGGVCG